MREKTSNMANAKVAGLETSMAALLDRYRQLLTSVDQLEVAAATQCTPVDVKYYRKLLISDLQAIERIPLSTTSISASAPLGSDTASSPGFNNASSIRNPDTNDEDKVENEAVKHKIQSSNLPFRQTVWNVATRCHDVVAISSRVNSNVVDVIANMGLLWIKVVSEGHCNLLLDMAKEERNESDDDSDTESSDFPLVKVVKKLVHAAQSTRIQYRRPECLIYFPNLEEDKMTNSAAKGIFTSLRATGATVHCGPGGVSLRYSTLLASSTTQEAADLQRMLPSTLPDLTSTLNLDCTILLALLSDLLHLTLDENATYDKRLKKQLTEEHARPLLTSILYPAFKGKKLIASRLAVQRMWEIVYRVGTPNEKMRADIWFRNDTFSTATPATLLSELQNLSAHPIPSDLRLPVEVIDSDIEPGSLPPAATFLHPVLSKISKINYSIITLGWKRNVTTVTSNRPLAKRVESILNKNTNDDDAQGPDMWVIDTARSLVNKERNRR